MRRGFSISLMAISRCLVLFLVEQLFVSGGECMYKCMCLSRNYLFMCACVQIDLIN